MASIQIKKNNHLGILSFLLESKIAILLIITNLAVFVFLQEMTFDQKRLSPVILIPGNILDGNLTCIITAGFIHHNWGHLLLNMLGIFIFARIVESKLGMLKTFFIYMGALFISMIFSTLVYIIILHKGVAILGASGAVMGLISAAILLDPFCITYEIIIPLPVMIKGWMFLYADLKGFLGGEKDGISHLAHLFGFLSVALLVYFLSNQDKRLMKTGLAVNIVSLCVFMFLKHKLGY